MKQMIPILAGVFLLTLGLSVQTAAAQNDLGRIIKQLQEDSDRFSSAAAKALDASEFDGTPREDDLIRALRDYEDSIDKLKRSYDDHRDMTPIHAREVQGKSIAVDKWLRTHSLGPRVASDWDSVKATLQRLRDVAKAAK